MLGFFAPGDEDFRQQPPLIIANYDVTLRHSLHDRVLRSKTGNSVRLPAADYRTLDVNVRLIPRRGLRQCTFCLAVTHQQLLNAFGPTDVLFRDLIGFSHGHQRVVMNILSTLSMEGTRQLVADNGILGPLTITARGAEVECDISVCDVTGVQFSFCFDTPASGDEEICLKYQLPYHRKYSEYPIMLDKSRLRHIVFRLSGLNGALFLPPNPLDRGDHPSCYVLQWLFKSAFFGKCSSPTSEMRRFCRVAVG